MPLGMKTVECRTYLRLEPRHDLDRSTKTCQHERRVVVGIAVAQAESVAGKVGHNVLVVAEGGHHEGVLAAFHCRIARGPVA